MDPEPDGRIPHDMSRSPSSWSALALVFAFIAGMIGPAGAQSSDTTGIIQITVHGEGTEAPLSDARVFLIGPTGLALTAGIDTGKIIARCSDDWPFCR